jgi:hypothetical protein
MASRTARPAMCEKRACSLARISRRAPSSSGAISCRLLLDLERATPPGLWKLSSSSAAGRRARSAQPGSRAAAPAPRARRGLRAHPRARPWRSRRAPFCAPWRRAGAAEGRALRQKVQDGAAQRGASGATRAQAGPARVAHLRRSSAARSRAGDPPADGARSAAAAAAPARLRRGVTRRCAALPATHARTPHCGRARLLARRCGSRRADGPTASAPAQQRRKLVGTGGLS